MTSRSTGYEAKTEQEDKALVGIDSWQKQALLLDHFPGHFAAGVQAYFIAHLDILTILVCEKIRQHLSV